MNRYPMITQNKERGIKILLDWCISQYQKLKEVSYTQLSCENPKGKWYERKEFLAELQRKQFYTETDKKRYNEIRELYFLLKRK